ncbi:MAG: DUF192 domain-containing protein [Planctomycetota bacterium]|nr:DUF192 domain-containing protein [Planctomycetota bacterium]
MSIRSWTIAGVCFLAAAGGCDRGEPGPAVTIRGTTWQVELAMTSDERYQGLSNRRSMPDGRGMLFLYPSADVRAYCMRRCLIDLDIAFIGPDLRVVKMYTMKVEPGGAAAVTYSSESPAQYVLETEAGALERAGVRAGDVVSFSAAVPEAAKARPGM